MKSIAHETLETLEKKRIEARDIATGEISCLKYRVISGVSPAP
jgi:hypothetical protein